ncbi:ricin-type beta-trefoil lectin domain protein [Streptomyces sp. NPDC085639]|uniref:ricin-type beta-trefoil lectin domain protein n=1 Tax=Streptomyces sp. NPDC085639 TaxID=3365734 RepID=UPI0037D82DE5
MNDANRDYSIPGAGIRSNSLNVTDRRFTDSSLFLSKGEGGGVSMIFKKVKNRRCLTVVALAATAIASAASTAAADTPVHQVSVGAFVKSNQADVPGDWCLHFNANTSLLTALNECAATRDSTIWRFYSDETLRVRYARAGTPTQANQFQDCLSVPTQTVANNTRVTVSPCIGGTGQEWVPGPNGRIYNPWSGLCLTWVSPGVAQSPMELRTCNIGTRGQNWSRPSTTGIGGAAWPSVEPQTITGVDNKCLKGGAKVGAANEFNAILWECNGTDSQEWIVNANSSVVETIEQKCLDTLSANEANGASVYVQPCDPSKPSQTNWYYHNHRQQIRKSNLCLAPEGVRPEGGRPDGTLLKLKNCDYENKEQRWMVQPPAFEIARDS